MSFRAAVMKRLHAPVYASRLRELVGHIIPHLRANDRVLDVGCGNGTLGAALQADPRCPAGVQCEGLERVVRGGEPIRVHAYDGLTIPFEANTFDAVILADVLHHDHDPGRLLRECARVTRRLLVIKDHQVKGLLAQQRISLLDWAANAPYGVPCLYRYNTPAQWAALPGELGLTPRQTLPRMKLYPFPYWLVFGGQVQYFTVLEKPAP